MEQDRSDAKVIPGDEALVKAMELEWQDHFQTRGQTWRTLQIESALAVGLVGVDLRFAAIGATLPLAALVILAAFFGCLITMRHRNDTEIRKFTYILNIERKLGLLSSDLLADAQVPKPIRWFDIVLLPKANTSLFILRMHVTIILFALILSVFRLVENIG